MYNNFNNILWYIVIVTFCKYKIFRWNAPRWWMVLYKVQKSLLLTGITLLLQLRWAKALTVWELFFVIQKEFSLEKYGSRTWYFSVVLYDGLTKVWTLK